MNEIQQVGSEAGVGERRKHSRKLVSGAALIPVDVEPDGSFGLLVDLSEDGAAIQTVTPIDSAGDKVLRWKFPGEEVAIEVCGAVVWSNPNKMVGVRFGKLPEDARSRISRWVDGIDDTREQPFVESATDPADDLAADDSTASDTTVAEAVPAPALQGDKLWVELQLSLLAAQVRSELPADGVALAVASGDVFECRASAGTAPEVGALLVGDAGLSAECVRTGQVICCVDTRTDTRVDANVCEALQLGSAVVLPIKTGAKVYALLEAFWGRPQGFGESQLTALCGFAQKFGELLGLTTLVEATAHNAAPHALSTTDIFSQVPGSRAAGFEPPAQVPGQSSTKAPDRCAETRTIPLGETLSQVEAGHRRDTIGRLLIAATVILAMVAVVTGVFAWYNPAAKTSAAPAIQRTPGAEPVDVGAGSSSVALPELTPRASTNAAATSPASVLTEPVITGVKVVSPRERTLAGRRGASKPSSPVIDSGRTVLLDVKMDKAGKITAVRVVSGDPKLARLAKDAVASNRHSISSPGGMTASPNARIVVSFGPNI